MSLSQAELCFLGLELVRRLKAEVGYFSKVDLGQLLLLHHEWFFKYHWNGLASSFWGYIKLLHAHSCPQQVKVTTGAAQLPEGMQRTCKASQLLLESSGSATTAIVSHVSVTQFNMHSINAAITARHTEWNRAHRHTGACTCRRTHTNCGADVQLLLYVSSSQKSAISVQGNPQKHIPHRTFKNWYLKLSSNGEKM